MVKGRTLRGSYTVEASYMVPVLLSVFLIGMCLSISFYKEVEEAHEENYVAELWEVDDFYRYQIVKEVVKK